MGKLSHEIGKLTDMLGTVLHRIDLLDKKTRQIEEFCSEGHAKLHREIEDLKKNNNTNMKEAILEMEQRAYRSSNIVIFGLDEPFEGSVEERKSSDLLAIKNILFKIDAQDSQPLALASQRLGKPTSRKPRPLRITGLSIARKSDILRKSRNLKNFGEYKNVFIKADLTPRQQYEAKILRTELQERRERGEKDLIIRRGQIISSSQNFH